MGCGKSSVGRRLSELLCCPFIDLDDVIELQTGRTIPEIFANDGEAAFRQMELEVLERILKPPTAIVSLGGGTVTQERCAEMVKENTVCIYLRASVDTLVSRLSNQDAGRPLLKGSDLRTRIDKLMEQRSAIYESTAHHILDTDGLSIDEVAQSITEIFDSKFSTKR